MILLDGLMGTVLLHNKSLPRSMYSFSRGNKISLLLYICPVDRMKTENQSRQTPLPMPTSFGPISVSQRYISRIIAREYLLAIPKKLTSDTYSRGSLGLLGFTELVDTTVIVLIVGMLPFFWSDTANT
jgi:hypothetical protein